MFSATDVIMHGRARLFQALAEVAQFLACCQLFDLQLATECCDLVLLQSARHLVETENITYCAYLGYLDSQDQTR